jgi:hypothetical protein
VTKTMKILEKIASANVSILAQAGGAAAVAGD